MKKVILIVATCMLYISCVTNSISGRSQLMLVSDADLQSMALTQYQSFLKANKVVPAGNRDADMVKRVGNRVSVALKSYFTQKGISNELNKYAWEFNLIDNKEINAWCMPGGKVACYTGLLSVTQTEAALAVVMGHEIAHEILGHGKERMSQQMAAQGLGALGGAALGGNAKAVNIFNQTYGLGAEYGALLPNSRKQELEADRFGLIFAAAAGYDPNVAVALWTRMAAQGNGQKPPVFMSDHPSDEQRIQKIKEVLPEALQYYRP